MAFVIRDGVLEEYTEEAGVTDIVIPDGVTEIKSIAFLGCKLTSVRIPEGVRKIGGGAFFGCRSLESVTLPDSIRSIEDGAFQMCSLRHLRIPLHIISIAAGSFKACGQLKTVTVQEITFVPEKLKGHDFHLAIEMLRGRDYRIGLHMGMKYAAVTGFYLRTNDARAEEFVKKNRSGILLFLIRNNNADVIRKLLESGKFVTKRNIDKCIAYAIEQGNPEIRMELLHYKSEKLGYKDIAETFKL